MKTIKTLIMSATSAVNGATGNFWIPKIEVWDVKTGELNIIVRLYTDEASFVADLSPLETKYFRSVVTDWQGKNIEEYAFDHIKAEDFFSGATESSITV